MKAMNDKKNKNIKVILEYRIHSAVASEWLTLFKAITRECK